MHISVPGISLKSPLFLRKLPAEWAVRILLFAVLRENTTTYFGRNPPFVAVRWPFHDPAPGFQHEAWCNNCYFSADTQPSRVDLTASRSQDLDNILVWEKMPANRPTYQTETENEKMFNILLSQQSQSRLKTENACINRKQAQPYVWRIYDTKKDRRHTVRRSTILIYWWRPDYSQYNPHTYC